MIVVNIEFCFVGRATVIAISAVPRIPPRRGVGKRRTMILILKYLPQSHHRMVRIWSGLEGRKYRLINTESFLLAHSDDDGLPSPAMSSARKPRGGRGGGRTPAGRGGGAKRGRGGGSAVSVRKPFNKQRYFKQKTFEESMISSYFEEDTRMSAADSVNTPSK